MVNHKNGKVVCCIVARTNSTRLHQKVLRVVSGRSMIEHIIDRMKAVPNLSEIYIATSKHPDDEILCDIARDNEVESYRGSELSVIDRLLDIADIESAEFVVRVTGDNIYTDSKLLQALVAKTSEFDVDYSRVEGAPIGVTAEVMKVSALKRCLESIEPEMSEYLMLYMFDPDKYRTLVLDVSSWVPPLTSLTVDTPEDWERTEFLQTRLASSGFIDLRDIVQLFSRENIPHFRLDSKSLVKLPRGKEMTLEQFMERQFSLARKSQVHVRLTEQEYGSE